MKLSISDRFLLDIYKIIEDADKTFDLFAPRTLKEVWCPRLFELRRRYQRKEDRERFKRVVSYLKRKGYIKIKNLNKKKGIILTRKGMEKTLKAKIKSVNRKKRADGKWEMIMFDIPEKKRKMRNVLRKNLRLLGYKMIQRSVWASPYEVSKETEGLIRKYSIDEYVKLFLIEEI